jgi:hypothetical protein
MEPPQAAYQIGQKPVTVEVVDSVLSADLDALAATLTRYGYNVRALAELPTSAQQKSAPFSTASWRRGVSVQSPPLNCRRSHSAHSANGGRQKGGGIALAALA